MTELLDFETLIQTFDDLPMGVGIFEVPDTSDSKSIRYIYMNKVILYEMRKAKEEVFGKKIIEVAPEAFEHEGGLMVMDTYRKVAAEGKSINLGLVEYSNHMVAGTYECSVHPIKENYVYVMLRNVTELEQKKQELEQKNNELRQYAIIASHDLKSPLNTVSEIINLIELQFKLDDSLSELLHFISDSTHRMRNVIDALLDHGRIGQGKEKTMVDCQKLLEVIQQDLATKIKETNAIIEVGKMPQIMGYKTELRLLFQNLISNGIKFSKPGLAPKVKISAKKLKGWTFTVEDNGIGIDKQFQEQIFNIFERLHDRRKYDGSGIGLAHCKKIIELHKGEIWVKSKPGEGSAFHFSIPCSV
ncbi:PAS domain-containing sensor histidine kinase [Reichenbachiella ulvae]|uniref:histidine kinase n=1 Tax=Reichenbachiella ulvae TaxID=2980104 RepID=A0ABT3CRJ9_9BACT|nr:ATP-binding protein [Reichenbachiella ulvae]MCV9386191.1 ATP-binding protein [Reichenbachiella ulvae]